MEDPEKSRNTDKQQPYGYLLMLRLAVTAY